MADALGLAANVIDIVNLFVKIGVLCSVYCADLKTAPRDIRYILNEADKFAATLKDVDRLLAGPNGAKIEASQNVRRGVADCRLQLDDLAAKLEQGTRWKRIMWPLKKEEAADIITKLERCRTAISLDLQVNQTTMLLDVHQEIVLAKLRTAKGATFDSHADADNARCHPGTRVDILQQILAWGAARDGECVFWLNGMAGTGKSTISRTVAQSFADKGMLGASFFFKRGEGDRGRMAFFFTTIAAQLVHQLPSLAPHIRDAIEADPTISEKSAKVQFDKLIADPIKKLPSHPQPSAKVIVVDALDECDALEHARLIILLLSQAKHFTSVRLRFFVTSRPELPIRLGFEDISGKYEDLVLHQMPKPVIEQDITAFLQHELTKIRQDYNKSVAPNRQLPPRWPGAEQIQKLVGMAIPLFIFAATVCRFIQDRRLGGPKDQLARILEHQTSRKSNLDATYLPVLDQLLVKLPESEQREVAARFKRIVGSIVILASPLSTSSLARLLAVSLDSIEGQLDLLHSVLSIPLDPSIPVRLLHLSFRDFLVDPEKGREQERYPFWVDERETHERLAARCLQLLSTGDILKRNVCGLRLPGTRRSEIDQQTMDAGLPPEVQYACRYWVYHWKDSKRRIRDGDLVDRFLTRHLLHWLEALGLLGRISESIGMVDDLLGLLDPEESSNISAFLRDTRRVILSHCAIIDISPFQVYYSTIVFAPEQSVVRKTFRNQFPAWLSLLPQVDSDWDACLQTLEGHFESVNSVAFSHDSTILASASDDETVRLWNVATGVCTATLEEHSDSCQSVAFSHDSTILASASDDKTIKLWNVATGVCTGTLEGHNESVCSVAFSHDSMILASASWDKTIKLWNVVMGVCTGTLEGHNKYIHSVTFSHDSIILASASWDKTIKLWDVVMGVCTATLDKHNGFVRSVAFSHDSTILASASDDKTIKLWNVATSVYTGTLEGHNESVCSVAFSHDSTILASASWDKTVKLWNVATSACITTLEGHNDVYSVAFSHDSTILASASVDKTVKLWNVTTSSCMATLERHSESVHSVTFSYDSTILASASNDKTVKLWDVVTGACTATFEGHSDSFQSVAFSYDSTILASVSDEYIIKLWDIAMGVCTATLKGHSSLVCSVAFSHDSTILASASDDETVKLWNVATGVCTATLEEHNDPCQSVAFSRDSTILASASDDKIIKLWNVATGVCTATLEGHNESVNSVAFSHDSTILASASNDKTVKLWNVATNACIATFKGHSYQVYSVAFSHNSTILASAADDDTVKLWDVATGACTATLDVGAFITHLAFDATRSSLNTDVGTFTLNSPSSPSPLSTSAIPAAVRTAPPPPTPVPAPGPLPQRVDRWGIGLSEDLAWVTWDSHEVLWLPPAYRPGKSAVTASTVAIGRPSGRVVLMTVSSDHNLLE